MHESISASPALRSHCVGRFLIDLPSGFEQHPASYAELFYGLNKDFRKINIEIVRTGGSSPSFDSIVGKRAAELTAEEHFASPSKSMLALRRAIGSNEVLLRSYQDSRLLDYFKATIFAQKGAAVAAFQSEVFAKDRPEDVEARMLKAVERATYIPAVGDAGRGTCLGPLVVDASQDGEILSAIFRAKSLPDVVIKVDMNSMITESDGGLLKRWDSKAGLLNKLNFQSGTLRRGKVDIGAMAGEELLSTGKDHGHSVRGFSAETLLVKPATLASPALAISMNMGGQVSADDYREASFSDGEALALWDAIVKSIRLRPGAA